MAQTDSPADVPVETTPADRSPESGRSINTAEHDTKTADRSTSYALRRLLPKGYLFRGRGLATLALATLSTLALTVGLLGLFLIAGLLVDRGRVVLEADQTVELRRLLGTDSPAPIVPPDSVATVVDGGILPQMVNADSLGPLWVAGLYKAIPALRSAGSALPVLALLTMLAGIVWKLAELAARAQADRLAHEAGVKLRESLHRQALRLNPGDLDGRGRRDAEALFIGQVDRVTAAIRESVYHVARDPVRLGLLVALLLLQDWVLALLVVVPVVLGWVLLEFEHIGGAATERLAQSRGQSHLRALAEALAKSRLIRGYGLESFEQEQFRLHMDHLQGELTSGQRTRRWRERLLWSLVVAMGMLVVYLIGAHILRSGRSFTAADGVFFLLTLANIAATLLSTRTVPAARRQIAVISEQINRYLDRIPDVSQAVGAKFLPPMERYIDFEKVTYKAPNGVTLLQDFELRIPAGSVTAFISIGGFERRDPQADSDSPDDRPTHVKRALDGQAALAAAMMLPRFLEPQSGRVLFDGEDIAWGTLESLREEVAYVGGREPFFTGTVHENLDCGQSLPPMTLIEAAKMCHVHKSILELPEGYETRLGEHGMTLDPGPAFLLGLARAAVRNPAVLIVEEPHVELSDDFKALADDAYQRLRADRTMLFLPQRLSTMRKCDRIVILKDGGVAAMGPQRDLVSRSELYRHWEYVTFNPLVKS